MTDRSADNDQKSQGAAVTAGKALREAKLAAALRVNLTRRKAAARAAATDVDTNHNIKNDRDDGQT